MGTLYECLREARLEQYYPAFRANGITRSETLSRLSVHDCTLIGITSTDDRRRMIELINIIKSVHNDSRIQSSTPQQSNTSSSRKMSSSTRRQNRSPNPGLRESASSQGASNPRGFEATRDVTVRDRTPNFSASSYVDMIELLSETSSEESSDDAVNSDEQNIPRHVAPSRPSSKHSQGQVERVKHTSGYNYGVPKSATKTKAKSSRTGDEKIRVCVRKRPTTRREERSGDDDIVQTEGSNTVIVNEPKQAVDLTAFTLQHEFVFDEVFDENCTNEDVYMRAARPLINTIFNNGNATCFAYGQTGAGKTHTMMGNPGVSGLYLLAAQDIFSIIQSKQYGDDLHVWVSFFEIYCGQLFDLLNKRNRLHAREDGSKRVCIAGLMETEAADVQGLVKVLDYGNSVRSKGATGVNPDSSRSHAILQMEIRDGSDHKLGRISFIDLAGSERAADVTDTDRQTRLEGAEINQSLLALKECIRSIDQSSRHKPFRQSKLTHILKDSFVGNSRTCMIANISPTMSACENSLNTLRYADRVKELKRSGSQSSNSRQVENLLMNIPINTPSVFHPSNILSCSTPNRQVTRHTAHRPVDNNQLDPSDTPVRGHSLRKKTTKSQKTSQNSTTAKTSQSQSNIPPHEPVQVSNRSSHAQASNIPSNPPNVLRQPVLHQNIPSPAATQNVSSPSGSDQTESETCNLTLPRNSNLAQPNIPVTRSTDTDNDFPTSDFNIPEEMNDLNKTGEKSHKKDAQSNSSGRVLPDTPVSSQTRMLGSDSVRPKEPPKDKPVTKSIPRSNSPATRRPYSAGIDTVHGASGITQPDHNPAILVPKPYTAFPILETAELDSIEDDQLFDGPVQIDRPKVTRQDSYPIASPLSKNGVSKLSGMNQLNVIPAVLPASSSDLSFTQRAPVRAPADMEAILLTPRAVDPDKQKHDIPIADISDMLQPEHIPDSPSLPQTIDEHLRRTPPPKESHQHSRSKARRTRHASQSSQSSDDSAETVRTSQSDSAQGPYKIKSKSKSKTPGLRKEKSDPIIALHMQTKKKTVPNPEEFHKYLSRANTPKAGQSASPMPVPITKSELSLADGSIPIINLKTDMEQHTGSVSRASPVQRNLDPESRLSPSLSGKQTAENKTKSKTRVSVATLLQGSKRVERATSPQVSRENKNRQHSTSDSPIPQAKSDSRIDVSLSSRSDASQQSSINSEILGRNIKTTTGSFVVRNNDSPKPSAAAVVTEKLTAGSIFSPIHPQPITSHAIIKTISPTSPVATENVKPNPIVTEVIQPKPVTPVPPTTEVKSVDVNNQLEETRSRLVTSHEDQLASVTSLCKQEMKLLLSAKSGSRSFEDYIRKLGNILDHKMLVMQNLQDQISTYCSEHGIPRHSVSQSTSSTSSCLRSHQHL